MTMHEQISELLPAYVLGDLPGPQAAEVKGHLTECAECRAEFGRLGNLLSHTDRMQALAADAQSVRAASVRLLSSLHEQSPSGPDLRVLSLRPTLWTRLKESRIMQSRSRRVAAAITASVLAAVGIVSVFSATFGGQPAWAIEQTIEALQQVRLVHGTGSFRFSENEKADPGPSGTLEFWATPDPNGPGEKDVKAVLTSGSNQWVGISHAGKTWAYSSMQNKVTQYEIGRTLAFDVLPGPGFMESLKKHMSEMSVQYGSDQESGRPCIFVTGASQKWGRCWWIQLDRETKLPVRLKEWIGLAPAGLPRTEFELTYSSEPPADDLFDYQVPDGAQVVDGRKVKLDMDPQHGIPVAGLTRDEVARRIATEYYQALIDKDWARAHSLRPAIDAHRYASATMVAELLEVGQPFMRSGCSIGPIVPCKVRCADGTIREPKMVVHFRSIDGQESCVIEAQWTGD